MTHHLRKMAASGEDTAFHGNKVCSVCGGSRLDDIHAATFLIEENATVNEGEESVISAATDAQARMDFGATLADDDVTSDDNLAAEFFHAEALAAGIATVLDGALSFFMGHGSR